MVYSTFEESLDEGSPVEMYRFRQGSSTFLWTSSEDSIVVGADTFLPIPISRTEIVRGPEARRRSVTVTLKSNNDLAQSYIGVQPGQNATLIITRLQRFDGVTPEIRQIFSGTVRAVSFTNDGFVAEFSVIPSASALNKTIPLYTFQRLCNHVVYDVRCKATEAGNLFSGSVTAVSLDGKTITVGGLDAGTSVGFATSGLLRIDALVEQRTVISHVATDDLILQYPFRAIVVGNLVTVLRGCDRTIQICKSEFDNVINYGGSAFGPEKDIFKHGV